MERLAQRVAQHRQRTPWRLGGVLQIAGLGTESQVDRFYVLHAAPPLHRRLPSRRHAHLLAGLGGIVQCEARRFQAGLGPQVVLAVVLQDGFQAHMIPHHQEAWRNRLYQQVLGRDYLHLCLPDTRVIGQPAHLHQPGGQRIWQGYAHLCLSVRAGSDLGLPVGSARKILARHLHRRHLPASTRSKRDGRLPLGEGRQIDACAHA